MDPKKHLLPAFVTTLKPGDIVIREAENGVVLLQVGDDLTLTETVFEDRQPITSHYIHADANPRIMSLGSALLHVAKGILATPLKIGLFIGLQLPGGGTLLDFPGSGPPSKE